LFGELFPATEQELSQDENFMAFVRAALQNTDRRVSEDKSVTPMFLLGVFLWLPIKKLAEIKRSEEKMSESQSLALASSDIVAQQQRRISLPRRYTIPMREMLALQPRFESVRGRRAMNLLEHRRFRAAYDFMMLQSEVGHYDAELAKFWTDVQAQSASERKVSFQMQEQPGKKRRPRRRRRRQSSQES